MSVLDRLEPKRVFHYFEEISAVPRGSGNMKQIAEYCMSFAEKHSLKAVRDEADNVVIFKPATKGYENREPVILQGHLDIVCQKEDDCDIDFEKDGLRLFIDGGSVCAKGTTLGADNGIAVAMILAILERNDISHPPIEALLTADEEIGMIGAGKLDTSILKGRRMINMDSEEVDAVTVSCAGGSDFCAVVPVKRSKAAGSEITVTLNGLKGGHSGVEINSGRINANRALARFLNYMNKQVDFSLISLDGGDKGNAIPLAATAKLCCNNEEEFKAAAAEYLNLFKTEISAREPDFNFLIITGDKSEYDVITNDLKNKLIYILLCAPNGVLKMSAEIEGLVETSLNLGILKTESDSVLFRFALRSNKKSALLALEDKLSTFFSITDCEIKTSGYYPPWEYSAESPLRDAYAEIYKVYFGKEPRIEAIHAGLECAVFADKIKNFEGIAIGPQMYGVHTVNERLDIASTAAVYDLIIKLLEVCK